jgi:hypothetical protein
MPRYFFAIRGTDQDEEKDPHGTIMRNDAEALSYAERTTAQLRKENAFNDDRGMSMVVRNAMREMIWSIPFLPGCA